MNIEFNKLDNVNGEITVVISKADLDPKVDEQLKKLSKTHKEPGFRPGHVPSGIIRKKYGDAVRYDVINRTLGDEIHNYITKENLKVLGNPVPDAGNQVNFEADEMVFKFRVGLAPEVKVNVDKDMHIPYYKIKVSDEMMERQDDALRTRFGAQVPGEKTEPNAVIKGSITELDADGNVKEGGIFVENGIISPAYFKSEKQKELFADKNVGAAIDFNPWESCDGNETELSSMLGIDKAQAADMKSDFRFDIKEIIVLKKAEHDQEFFDSVFGKDTVHNEEEYNARLREIIAAQLEQDANFRFTIDARDALLKAAGEIELPDDVLKDYLRQQGETKTPDEAAAEYARMRPDLVWQLVRDAVASELEIKLEEADLLNAAIGVTRAQFAQYGMTNVGEDMIKKYAENILKDPRSREQMAHRALDNKLFNGVRARVSLDEKDVDVEEFNALFTVPGASPEA